MISGFPPLILNIHDMKHKAFLMEKTASIITIKSNSNIIIEEKIYLI